MKLLRVLAIIASVVMASCVSVPQAAIQLSAQIDNMIMQAKVAHINTVDQHFSQMILMIDQFAMGEYKQVYLNYVRSLMKQKDSNFVDLTPAEYDAAIMHINNTKQLWLQELLKNKNTVVQSVEQFYDQLTQAHDEITNLLLSITNSNTASTQMITNLVSSLNGTQLSTQLQASTTGISNMLNDALQKVGK